MSRFCTHTATQKRPVFNIRKNSHTREKHPSWPEPSQPLAFHKTGPQLQDPYQRRLCCLVWALFKRLPTSIYTIPARAFSLYEVWCIATSQIVTLDFIYKSNNFLLAPRIRITQIQLLNTVGKGFLIYLHDKPELNKSFLLSIKHIFSWCPPPSIDLHSIR